MDVTDRASLACPHCGAAVDLTRAWEGANGVWRVGCLNCGVQLVRRGSETWETIRG